jgi:integrase
MKTVITERVIHGGMNRVALKFPYDAELIKITRGLPDPKWSWQMNAWHIPDSNDIITLLLKAFSGKAYIDYTALKPSLTEKIMLIPADLLRERKLLRIRQSRGFKDRVVPISEKLIGMVNTYIKHYKPARYLFEGHYSVSSYSASSLNKVT